MTKRPIRHLRWYIAVLLCFATELNYLDRQTLSVLADTIQRDLNLTTIDYSHITSSFLVSYAVMYAVSGRVIDIVGTRRGFMIFVSAWSITNMLHGFANTALQFSVFRFLLGAAEPANFPAGVKAVSEWFPMRERALAVGIFNAGTAMGSVVAVIVVLPVTTTFVAAVPPRLTVAPDWNPVPVMVTAVPPLAAPELGAIEVTVGTGLP